MSATGLRPLICTDQLLFRPPVRSVGKGKRPAVEAARKAKSAAESEEKAADKGKGKAREVANEDRTRAQSPVAAHKSPICEQKKLSERSASSGSQSEQNPQPPKVDDDRTTDAIHASGERDGPSKSAGDDPK